MNAPRFAADDAALDALFVPFDGPELRLPPSDPVLFLRARAGHWAQRWRSRTWVCEQSFKPFADALLREGLDAGQGDDDAITEARHYPLVLTLPPRQRDEARALLARAVRHAERGGIVVASVANNEGARAVQSDLERIAGQLGVLSKHKCRVFWTAPLAAPADAALVDEWLALDAPQPIANGRLLSRRGLFAWDRIDAASALLAAHLPADLHGRVADLGAGIGYLSTEVVKRCAAVTAIDMYEAEHRAERPARSNLAAAATARGTHVAVDWFWHDVTRGLPHRYDAIVSNPPFHQGRADQPDLGRAFIAAAASALHPHGRFWMVANRHLPYEATLAERFAGVRVVDMADGFKVFEATGPHA